jgi:subfamily B ATP-binding cassette protein HlyB/CyaB
VSADIVPPTEHYSGLIAFQFVLQCCGTDVDAEHLKATAAADGRFGVSEMLSAAAAHGYDAWQHCCCWEQLVAVPFPALAELHDGRFLVLGAFAEDRVLLQDPKRRTRTTALNRERFCAVWSGRLVLLTTPGVVTR